MIFYMKRFISLFLILSVIFVLSSCSDGGLQAAVFEWNTPPYNIDPLLATEQGELTVVKNIFEPLMVAKEDGTLVCGAAKDYSLSGDGLTYSFIINTKSKWSDGTAVTPADFVFALKRAVDPKTKSTCAIFLQSLVNAPEIMSGELSVDKLGVSVKGDSLIINLSKKDNNLLRTLSGVAGMPCNSAFFEKSGGKYGMTEDTIISNGPFYVSSWNTDQDMESLRISKNQHYKGKNVPYISRVRFSYEDTENRFNRLKNSEIDCGGMDADLMRLAEDEGITTLKYGLGTTCLLFNTNTSVFKNEQLRKALTVCADIESAKNGLPSYTLAKNTIMGMDYLSPNGLYGGATYLHSKGDGRSLFASATKGIDSKDISNLTLYYVDNDESKLYASYIAQSWQKDLGLYVTLTAVSNKDAQGLLSSGDYSFIICPLSSANNMASEVLSNFTAPSEYGTGLKVSDDFDRLVALGDEQSLKTAEEILYKQNRVIPLFETYSSYCIGNKVKEYKLFSGSNILDFSKMR